VGKGPGTGGPWGTNGMTRCDMRWIGLALLAALGVATAAAQATTRIDARLDDAVPGHPGVTYGALLKQIAPDLAKSEGDVWTTAGIKGLRDPDGEPDEGGPASFDDVSTLEIASGGKPVLLMMAPDAEGNGFLSILGAFDLSTPTPALIDYVNAGMDRTTSLGTPVPLAKGTDAVTVTGWHNNSNESYNTLQVVMLHEGKLTSVLYTGTYSLLICGMRVEQQGALTAGGPEPSSPYVPLIFTVTQTVERPDEDCGEGGLELLPAGTLTARDVFHWDAASAKFVSQTNELGKLMGPE